MTIPNTLEELTEVFKKLGAESPELWAGSQLNEGISQLMRFVFLKQAWSRINDEGDTKWIDREIASSNEDPARPYAGLGLALARCIDRGASKEDLAQIGRCIQAQTLFDVAYLIDGPAYGFPGLEDIGWGLFQTDDDGKPFGPQIEALSESVLDLDPTGREMRPKEG